MIKIKRSIKTKIRGLLSAIVIVSLSSYSFFAIHNFKRDKEAYIFDSLAKVSDQHISTIFEHLQNRFQDLVLFDALKLTQNEPLLKQITDRQPDILMLGKWIKDRDSSDWQFQNYIEKDAPVTLPPDVHTAKGKFLQHTQSYFDLYIQIAGADEILFMRDKAPVLASIFRESGDIKHGIYSGLDNSDSTDPVIKATAQAFLNERPELITKELMLTSGSHLVSMQKFQHFPLVLWSTISRDQAFLALKMLINKSAVFALLLLILAIMGGNKLAKTLTDPLVELVGATQKIARGDFKTKVPLKTQDEVGVLSESFNLMSAEILRYMEEVQEKARMQNELAVAQLVQNAFFPSAYEKLDELEIAGYYAPASECGGDWWGHQTIQGKTLVFCGDATGHGVPAALITATVNCCANLIPDLIRFNPKLIENPAHILEIFNRAVHRVGGKILMTLFLAIIDNENQKLSYSNASHNPPFLLRHPSSGNTFNKEHLEVLMEGTGPRLGHKKDATYDQGVITFGPKDQLVLFSDGIIEGENPDKQIYGERRFMKSILEAASMPSKSMLSKLLEDANNFYQGIAVNDDLTLVIVKGTHTS